MRASGPLAVKVPILLLGIALISRAIGFGSPAPLMSMLRAFSIILRVVIDFVTDIMGSADGWFLAFVLSLTWPMYTICNYWWQKQTTTDRLNSAETTQEDDERADREPTTPSQKSYATTRTVSESMHSRRSEHRAIESPCQSDGLLLNKRRNRPFAKNACAMADASWRRISDCDGRTVNAGKTNAYDECDRIKLCPKHSDLYNEWVMSRRCMVRRRMGQCSGDVIENKVSRICANRQRTECDQKRERRR